MKMSNNYLYGTSTAAQHKGKDKGKDLDIGIAEYEMIDQITKVKRQGDNDHCAYKKVGIVNDIMTKDNNTN